MWPAMSIGPTPSTAACRFISACRGSVEEIPAISPLNCWMATWTFGVIERSVKLAAALDMTMLPMVIGGSGEAGVALVAGAAGVLATVATLVSLVVAGALVSAGAMLPAGCNAASRLMVWLVSMTRFAATLFRAISLMATLKWIHVGVNAGNADGIPLQQILAQGAIHGAKSVEPRVALEGNLRQLTRRGAQLNPAVETELAAGNVEVQFGFEIRIQRAKIEPVQIKLDVGGRRREGGGHFGFDGAVGVPAQGQMRR